MIMGTYTSLSFEEKATPKLNPSKKLWIKEESRFKYPADPLPLRFYQHPLLPYLFYNYGVGSLWLSFAIWARAISDDRGGIICFISSFSLFGL